MIKSVSYSQSEIIKNILKLHCPEGIQCDITYGNGSFYKDIEPPSLKSDLDPQSNGVLKCCSTNLPYENNSIKSIMFDPPFLTYIKAGREHNSLMAKRFGGYWRYEELEDHYSKTAREASRVLEVGGVLVVKCQDVIHNHKMHCTHAKMIGWCESASFRILDLFVLPAKNRLPLPEKQGERKRSQKHARIYHSYFLVFKKLKEPQ